MNQQPQLMSSHSFKPDNELDLIGVWRVIVEYKILISIFTFVTTVGAIFYASTLPNVYTAQVTMMPPNYSNNSGSGAISGLSSLAGISLSTDSDPGIEGRRSLTILKTRSFLSDFIKKRNLKQFLFNDLWDKKNSRWIDKEPSDGIGAVTLTIKWKNIDNPDKVAEVINDLANNMNYYARQDVIITARNGISFLEKELEATSLLNSKSILYGLIEQQMVKIMTANVTEEYAFKIIDPAFPPEKLDPKNTLAIILFGMISGIFFSIFLSLSIVYFKRQ